MSLVLPGETLRAELKAMGFSLPDAPMNLNCFCPSEAWLKEMCQWIAENPWQYVAQKHKCVQAAWNLVEEANIAFMENTTVDGVGHSVFLCTFTITEGASVNNIGGGGHCSCVVRTPEGWFILERESGLYEKIQPRLDDGSLTPNFALA